MSSGFIAAGFVNAKFSNRLSAGRKVTSNAVETKNISPRREISRLDSGTRRVETEKYVSAGKNLVREPLLRKKTIELIIVTIQI